MTYQIIITEETSANIIIDNNTTNVSITTNEYPITIQYNAVIEQAGGNAYGNSNVAAYLASSSLAGNIITSANISGAYILGNGSQLTGIVATSSYGNANVAANLAAFGSNPISTSGNITAGYFAGNGSLLTNITAGNITGTVANATYALNANAATYATNAVQAATANVANSVAGANVTGTVANATYALNSNAATFATQATFATTANAVAGANVSGTVANATYALNANASTYSTNAIQANVANVANSVAGANVTGTVANATYALNSNAATFAGTVTTAAQPNITSVGILTAVNTSGNVSATGNITGNYFIGNGSLLTGIATSSYGNANVAANLAAFANNPISTSGNITAGNINTTNYVAFGTTGAQTTAATGQMFWDTAEQTVSLGMNNGVTQQIGLEQYILVKASATITNGQAVMFTGANGDNVLAAPADTTSVGFRPEYIIGIATQDIANNAFGYITTFGSVHGLNTNAYTVGDILWVSNATPGALTNTRPTDPNFQIEIAAVTKKSGGDGHIQVRVKPFNNIDSLTDVTITTPSTGQALVYSGNVWVNGNPQLANTANTVTNNAQANITSVGTLTSLSVSGNVTANYFIGNGSQLTGIASSSYGNANVADFLANGFGSNTITTTGNITTGIVTATANIGSTQQTIIGTANATASSTGNIVLSGKNIATDVVFAPDVSTNTTPTGGRVLIGTGIAGNTSILAYDPTNILRGSRVAIMDSYTKNTSGVVSGQLSTWAAVALDGNITTNAARVHGISSFVAVSGGAAGNSFITAGGGAINNGLNALQGTLQLGGTPSVVGGSASNLVPVIGANITTRYATATSGILQFNGNGTVVGNGYGHIASMFNNATGNISIANVAAYGATFVDLVTTTANVGNTIGYLFPDTTQQLFGLQQLSGSYLRSGNIYAFMNAGNLAQVRLGSTREQHYYAFPITPATGNVIVDASKGKVQTLTLTGNVSVTDFTNFVTTAFNSGTATNIPQQDDVTLIINQPNTGPTYTVTLPTTVNSGASPVQYQNGVTAVNQDNYGRTYVNIRSQPDSMGGFPFYVVVESTAGSLPAAGSDALVQFNDGNVLGAVQGFSYSKTTAILAAGNIIAYNSVGNVWGDINAANIYTQPGGQVAANNINGFTQVTTPQLYANSITDGGFVGTGNIAVNAGTVNVTGNLSVTGNITSTRYNEKVYSYGNATGTITPDLNNGSIQKLTLTGNITLNSLTNVATGGSATMILTQDATGNRLLTSTWKFAGNSRTLSTAANSVDIVSVFYDGTSYYASLTTGYA